MHERSVITQLGEISLSVDEAGTGPPLVFMHGVFLDRSLWAEYDSKFTGRTHVYIDMPAHGNSSNVGHDWSLEDCAGMLIAILDELGIRQCIAVGQSWGSMTALRAASTHPSRFAGLALFNMPFQASTGLGRLGFRLQKLMVGFQNFYGAQAAKSLYSESLLRERPELSTALQARLRKRLAKEISRVIDAVILNAEDAAPLLNDLKVPALAIAGETDYVGQAPGIETVVVPGGHVSPTEAVDQSKLAIQRVIGMTRDSNDPSI